MIFFTGASQNNYNHIEVIRKTIVKKIFWPHLIKQLLKHDESLIIYPVLYLFKYNQMIFVGFVGDWPLLL